MGQVAEKAGENHSRHAQQQCIQTEEPFLEYLRVISSVRKSIQQRQDYRQAYIDALTDVEVKQTAHNKLLGASGKTEQANLKHQQVVKAQANADAAKLLYEQVTERFLIDFENFKQQKAHDIRTILLRFIEIQVS